MTLEEKLNRILSFVGPIAATATPFNEINEVDGTQIVPYVSYLSSIGVKGVWVHGSMGEGLSLTNEEKMQLTRIWWQSVKTQNIDMLMIFNVTNTSIVESMAHVKLCAKLQVDGIGILPPFYYRPKNVKQLVSYLSAIASNAPDIPLIYYHIPGYTGVNFNLEEFVREALKEVPSLAGIKYTCGDIIEANNVQINHRNHFKIFPGYEQTLLPMLSCGMNAAIGGLFNFKYCVDAYKEMLNHKDLKAAQSCQERITRYGNEINEKENALSAIKKMISINSNNEVNLGLPRLPLF